MCRNSEGHVRASSSERQAFYTVHNHSAQSLQAGALEHLLGFLGNPEEQYFQDTPEAAADKAGMAVTQTIAFFI